MMEDDIQMYSSSDVPLWVQVDSSLSKPSAARIYNWLLGGWTNFEMDRDFGRRLESILPNVKMYAHENREFLGRAVSYCLEQGIRQFVDIGSGIPAGDYIHDIADKVTPSQTRVVYIDKDPVAYSYMEQMLKESGDLRRQCALHANLLDAQGLWQKVIKSRIIDPNEPVALLIVAVLHFIKDDQDPVTPLAFYRKVLPPGSFLVMSHFTDDDCTADEEIEAHRKLVEYYEQSNDAGQLRSRAEFRAMFGDYDIVPPGIVYTPQWRPDPNHRFDRPSKARILAGVGKKPVLP